MTCYLQLLRQLLLLALLASVYLSRYAAGNSVFVEVKPFETETKAESKEQVKAEAEIQTLPLKVRSKALTGAVKAQTLTASLTAPTKTTAAKVAGPEAAYMSRCWKSGFSPANKRPVDHTPHKFIAFPTCRGRVYVVSIVHSAVGNHQKRELIRHTWGSVANVDGRRLALVFVIGRSTKAEENLRVEQESKEFGDMVVANFQDHYRNLTYKNLYGVKWALEHCRNARFVLKVDDDVLVNPFQLVSYISDRLDDAKKFFYCKTARETKMTERWQKWYVTPEEWPAPDYPVHCKGLGYLFSADLLPGLHLCAKWRSYFWIDDIFVTGAVGQALGASMLHWAPGWDFQYLHPRHTGRKVNEAILYNEYDSTPVSLLTRRVWRAMLIFST